MSRGGDFRSPPPLPLSPLSSHSSARAPHAGRLSDTQITAGGHLKSPVHSRPSSARRSPRSANRCASTSSSHSKGRSPSAESPPLPVSPLLTPNSQPLTSEFGGKSPSLRSFSGSPRLSTVASGVAFRLRTIRAFSAGRETSSSSAQSEVVKKLWQTARTKVGVVNAFKTGLKTQPPLEVRETEENFPVSPTVTFASRTSQRSCTSLMSAEFSRTAEGDEWSWGSTVVTPEDVVAALMKKPNQRWDTRRRIHSAMRRLRDRARRRIAGVEEEGEGEEADESDPDGGDDGDMIKAPQFPETLNGKGRNTPLTRRLVPKRTLNSMHRPKRQTVATSNSRTVTSTSDSAGRSRSNTFDERKGISLASFPGCLRQCSRREHSMSASNSQGQCPVPQGLVMLDGVAMEQTHDDIAPSSPPFLRTPVFTAIVRDPPPPPRPVTPVSRDGTPSPHMSDTVESCGAEVVVEALVAGTTGVCIVAAVHTAHRVCPVVGVLAVVCVAHTAASALVQRTTSLAVPPAVLAVLGCAMQTVRKQQAAAACCTAGVGTAIAVLCEQRVSHLSAVLCVSAAAAVAGHLAFPSLPDAAALAAIVVVPPVCGPSTAVSASGTRPEDPPLPEDLADDIPELTVQTPLHHAELDELPLVDTTPPPLYTTAAALVAVCAASTPELPQPPPTSPVSPTKGRRVRRRKRRRSGSPTKAARRGSPEESPPPPRRSASAPLPATFHDWSGLHSRPRAKSAAVTSVIAVRRVPRGRKRGTHLHSPQRTATRRPSPSPNVRTQNGDVVLGVHEKQVVAPVVFGKLGEEANLETLREVLPKAVFSRVDDPLTVLVSPPSHQDMVVTPEDEDVDGNNCPPPPPPPCTPRTEPITLCAPVVASRGPPSHRSFTLPDTLRSTSTTVDSWFAVQYVPDEVYDRAHRGGAPSLGKLRAMGCVWRRLLRCSHYFAPRVVQSLLSTAELKVTTLGGTADGTPAASDVLVHLAQAMTSTRTTRVHRVRAVGQEVWEAMKLREAERREELEADRHAKEMEARTRRAMRQSDAGSRRGSGPLITLDPVGEETGEAVSLTVPPPATPDRPKTRLCDRKLVLRGSRLMAGMAYPAPCDTPRLRAQAGKWVGLVRYTTRTPRVERRGIAYTEYMEIIGGAYSLLLPSPGRVVARSLARLDWCEDVALTRRGKRVNSPKETTYDKYELGYDAPDDNDDDEEIDVHRELEGMTDGEIYSTTLSESAFISGVIRMAVAWCVKVGVATATILPTAVEHCHTFLGELRDELSTHLQSLQRQGYPPMALVTPSPSTPTPPPSDAPLAISPSPPRSPSTSYSPGGSKVRSSPLPEKDDPPQQAEPPSVAPRASPPRSSRAKPDRLVTKTVPPVATASLLKQQESNRRRAQVQQTHRLHKLALVRRSALGRTLAELRRTARKGGLEHEQTQEILEQRPEWMEWAATSSRCREGDIPQTTPSPSTPPPKEGKSPEVSHTWRPLLRPVTKDLQVLERVVLSRSTLPLSTVEELATSCVDEAHTNHTARRWVPKDPNNVMRAHCISGAVRAAAMLKAAGSGATPMCTTSPRACRELHVKQKAEALLARAAVRAEAAIRGIAAPLDTTAAQCSPTHYTASLRGLSTPVLQ
eukprot:Sspe_Gene.44577::Locus_21872_Transcript_1_1_Confidence_1.000_Length_5077::g.44577::m.44577